MNTSSQDHVDYTIGRDRSQQFSKFLPRLQVNLMALYPEKTKQNSQRINHA